MKSRTVDMSKIEAELWSIYFELLLALNKKLFSSKEDAM